MWKGRRACAYAVATVTVKKSNKPSSLGCKFGWWWWRQRTTRSDMHSTDRIHYGHSLLVCKVSNANFGEKTASSMMCMLYFKAWCLSLQISDMDNALFHLALLYHPKSSTAASIHSFLFRFQTQYLLPLFSPPLQLRQRRLRAVMFSYIRL